MTDALPLADLLPTLPSTISFGDRVRQLALTPELQKKILVTEFSLAKSRTPQAQAAILTIIDEKELASEVLLLRHRFSEMLFARQDFRQAALTILQNIYLFKNRKIFFDNSSQPAERERQEALLLFSSKHQSGLPLVKTLQHLVMAKIWNRILAQSSPEQLRENRFLALHAVVERLNTIRNIYMLMSTGLVRKLARKTHALYRQSVTYDDAVQIGGIGVARAAYRYHQSCGVRFSTFAANWISREIQLQALNGRLIRVSTNIVEACTKAGKSGDSTGFRKYAEIIANAAALQEDSSASEPPPPYSSLTASSPARSLERCQCRSLLLKAIDQKLCPKSSDIIKRRYGLPPYHEEQSILAISRKYGVTRSSIYQLERSALRKLQKHLDREAL